MYDLLRTLKLLCQVLWRDKVSYIEELHLTTILNMLKAAHFNSRMNALKEVGTDLIEFECIGFRICTLYCAEM